MPRRVMNIYYQKSQKPPKKTRKQFNFLAGLTTVPKYVVISTKWLGPYFYLRAIFWLQPIFTSSFS